MSPKKYLYFLVQRIIPPGPLLKFLCISVFFPHRCGKVFNFSKIFRFMIFLIPYHTLRLFRILNCSTLIFKIISAISFETMFSVFFVYFPPLRKGLRFFNIRLNCNYSDSSWCVSDVPLTKLFVFIIFLCFRKFIWCTMFFKYSCTLYMRNAAELAIFEFCFKNCTSIRSSRCSLSDYSEKSMFIGKSLHFRRISVQCTFLRFLYVIRYLTIFFPLCSIFIETHRKSDF